MVQFGLTCLKNGTPVNPINHDIYSNKVNNVLNRFINNKNWVITYLLDTIRILNKLSTLRIQILIICMKPICQIFYLSIENRI